VSLRGELERAHAARPRDAAVALDLLEVLRWTHPDDTRDDRAKRLALATDAQVRSARSAWLLAQLHDDPAVTRAALDAGVERARKAPAGSEERALLGPLLYELALRTRALGLERRARELLLEAAAAAPDDPTIELARIDVVATDGYSLAALAWLERLARRFPESSTVGDALVGQLLALGRTEAALTRLRGAGPGDTPPRDAGAGSGDPAAGEVGDLLQARRRIDALLTLGRPDDAVALARRIAGAAPGLPSVHVELAHLEQARGELDAARTALAQAIALSPQDARLYAELGRLAARAGDDAGAIAALQRSLRLMPQQPAVRDLLAVLDAQAPADVFTRWAVALDEVATAPTPRHWQGKEAGILHERTAIRVLSNGLTERLEHRILRILDDRGARNQAVQAIAYDPSETTVDLRRARVRRPDGTVEDLGRLQTASLTQAGYRMYYDQRQARAVFEGLRAGDVVEVAWVRRDIAARNMFDEYFGDVIGLQGLLPSLHTEIVIEAPASKPLFFNVPVATEQLAAAKGEPALVRYRHVAKDVPAIKPEPRMPGYAESARYLAVSTYRDWDEVGRWYWDLVDEQLVVDQAIREGVGEALAGLPPDATTADKVARIYTHVVRTTRYVGLEFGIHGYKPYRTTDVYARRFGDCKDKASLLKVMLAEAGIVSHLVLVRTQDLGTMGDGPASLATFNHAIVYVPALDLYLDGTAEWAGPTELPAGDQGATVLVVKDGAGAELRTTPVLPAAANSTTTVERVALTAAGDATVEHHITVAGADAASVRYAFQSADERAERLAQVWGQGFPGARVLDVRSPAIDDIGRAAELRTRLQIPGWAQRSEGKGLRFKVTGQSSSLVQTYAPMTARTHPLVLDLPSVDVRELTVDVPQGYSLARVPSSTTVDGGPLGRFELEVRAEGRRATVRRALTLTARTVEPGQYGALREFLRRIDETLEQTIEVEVER
jgi:tetratricopeptide (TPR) repeat protein